MTRRHWTLLVFGLLLIGVVIWDVFLATNGVDGDTISESIAWVGGRSLVFALVFVFALGVLVGHFFWAQPPQEPKT